MNWTLLSCGFLVVNQKWHIYVHFYLLNYKQLENSPGGNGGISPAAFFNSGGVISLKFPNLSKTTCPCGILFKRGRVGLTFLGESGFLGGGSFMAIAFLTLTAFSVGWIGSGIEFFLDGGGDASSKLELFLCLSLEIRDIKMHQCK